ncbi:MAG TPA: Crp/Fnr family transcriptional regulator [Acidimicrobiia bacterium]|nr:Crp/Fnr family transcriptional regulator [Acidimicrobiia bacterium]
MLALARRRKFAKGEVLFHEGDPGDSLHLVSKGHLAARGTTPLGDVATLRVLSPGDHFGELAVLSPGPRNATVVALEPAETLALHASNFATLRAEHRSLEAILVDSLVAEVRRLAAALLEALYLPVDKRLWRRIDELAATYGQEPPITIPLTQEDLAQLAGTTRQTANRMLRDGEREGALDMTRGRVTVRDLEWVRRHGR